MGLRATEQILSMKKIHELVLLKHSRYLEWFGIMKHFQNEYSPTKVASLLLDFASDINFAKRQLEIDQKMEIRKQEPVQSRNTPKETTKSEKNKKCNKSNDFCEQQTIETKYNSNNLEEYLASASKDLNKAKARKRTYSRQSSSSST